MQSHQTHCSNTRSVNVIRAGKPRSTWKDDMELDMDVDMEGFQNTSSVVFSNSQSNVFPSFPNNPNSISNKLFSISLDGKRKRHISKNNLAPQRTRCALGAPDVATPTLHVACASMPST